MAPTISKGWDDFEILGIGDPTCITWASSGGDGSGKSYFGCTAPGPIFVAAFDPHGMSRVDKLVRDGKDIRIRRYGFNHLRKMEDRAEIRKQGMTIWSGFMQDYDRALQTGAVRSILWDREDLAWELIRFAYFGGEKNEGSKTGALDYGDLNAEYVSLIQAARDSGKNLGLLRGVTDKWVAKYDPGKGKMVNYNTGELVSDGFKKVNDHVDITLVHQWSPKEKEYTVKIGKFPNKLFKDQEIANLDFGTMAIDAFPESEVENWI